MVGWILGKIKWLMIIAMLGGPFMAYMSYQDGERIKEIQTKGINTVAVIKGATEKKRRRGGTSYTVDLVWKDKAGAERKSDGVSISSSFAGNIIKVGKIMVRMVPIRYLVDQPDVEPVIVPDQSNQAGTDDFMIKAGALAGGVGLLGTIGFFLLGRRRRDEA